MGAEKYGMPAFAPASNIPTGLSSIATASLEDAKAEKLLSVSNPLTVFGVVAAVTFGLMAFSTSVRVGNSSASLNLGKS